VRIPLHLLLLQLLPIIAFLIVDSLVRDPLWAIVAALVCVALLSALSFWQNRRFDRFILIDALLIGTLGAATLISQNELFFRLKPAVIEAAMVPFLLFLALGKEATLLGYLSRFGGEGTPAPEALKLLRKLFTVFAALMLVHAVVVVFFALYGSRAAWAWVSGPGFYLLLVPVFGWIVVLRIRRARAARRAAEPEEAAPRPRVSGRRDKR
jgi:intracellular septation protein A